MVNLRIYEAGGALQTTVVPTLDHVFLIGYSWDGSIASLLDIFWN